MVNPGPRPSNEFVTDEARATQRDRILAALHRTPEGMTRNEIALLAGLPIQSVCARVGELLADGLLRRGPRRTDAITGSANETLRARPHLPAGQSRLEAFA